MAAQTHPPIIPFPTDAQTAQAVTTLIEVVTDPGAGHDACCVTNACWVVLGYAGERFLEPCPAGAPAQVPLGDEAKLDLLRQVKQRCEAGGVAFAGAVPWRLIIDMVYQILVQFFPMVART